MRIRDVCMRRYALILISYGVIVVYVFCSFPLTPSAGRSVGVFDGAERLRVAATGLPAISPGGKWLAAGGSAGVTGLEGDGRGATAWGGERGDQVIGQAPPERPLSRQ